jgi:hypothetical protein
MRYRKLDPLNDYSFGNGQLDFWDNVPMAVGQAVQTGLMLWLGEWYLDTSQGTPYIQGVLGKQTQAIADGTIQNQIANTTGVVDISSYASEFNTQQRTFSAQTSIDTIYGPTPVDIANFRYY